MSRRVKAVVVGAFVLALGAGTLMGVGVARLSRPVAAAPKSQLATELQLRPDQQAQMETIWSKAMQLGGPSFMDRRKAIQEERDQELADLLPPAMLLGYDKIMAAYREKLDGLNAERQKAFEEAQEQTKAILTPEQRKAYEALMARRSAGRHDRRPTGLMAATAPGGAATMPGGGTGGGGVKGQ